MGLLELGRIFEGLEIGFLALRCGSPSEAKFLASVRYSSVFSARMASASLPAQAFSGSRFRTSRKFTVGEVGLVAWPGRSGPSPDRANGRSGKSGPRLRKPASASGEIVDEKARVSEPRRIEGILRAGSASRTFRALSMLPRLEIGPGVLDGEPLVEREAGRIRRRRGSRCRARRRRGDGHAPASPRTMTARR